MDKTEKVHKYLRQALACANKCLEGVLPSDEYYEGFCDMTVFSLQKLVAYGGAYIKAIEPKEDPVAASLLVKATEQAVALLPNPTNIVAMAKAYYTFDKDYVKAARWYRKALALPEEECSSVGDDGPDCWKYSLVLAQLQIPGMPLEGWTLVSPIGPPGPMGEALAYR